MESAEAAPFESELYGASVAAAAAPNFGIWWDQRSFGLGAVKILWTKHGIQSLEVFTACVTNHVNFETRFTASISSYWFKLMKSEYLTEILFRESESRDQISALCLQTNMRHSQWYGSTKGTLRKISAPPGFYIHMIHGSSGDGSLQNLGVYCVPLSLRVSGATHCTLVAESKVIGDVEYDTSVLDNC